MIRGDEGDPIFGDKQDPEYRIPLAEITQHMWVFTSAIARAVRKMEGRGQKCKFSTTSPWPQLLQGGEDGQESKDKAWPEARILKNSIQ
jgi:hypothetical protein